MSASVLKNDVFLRALLREPVPYTPIWLMRQAGRYLPDYRATRAKAQGFLDFCLTPKLAIEATLQPIDRFGMDAAILFADLPLPALGLGRALDYREGEGPVLEPLTDSEAVKRLDLAGVRRVLAPVFDTVAGVRAKLAREVALIGFAGAPWTVATYMVAGQGSRDQAETRRLAYSDHAAFKAIIARIEEVTLDYLSAQVEAGAEVVQLFDDQGEVIAEIPRTARSTLANPVVVDADNDGAAELVLVGSEPIGGDDVRGERASVMLIQNIDDAFAPTRRIWNQHAYHGTNIREDARVPMQQQPHWLQANGFRTNSAPGYVGGLCQPPAIE